MGMGQREKQRRQEQLSIAHTELPRAVAHPFYEQLNRVLEGRGFDEFLEQQCSHFYAEKMGRPSLAPGRYFRLLLIGYFEGIERAWCTCQDRLVSELRLAQACNLDSANQVLARFCADYNQRFDHCADAAACDFRTLARRFDLARCLSFRYQRVVGPDHVISFGAHAIALPALSSKRGYAGNTVDLSHHLDATLHIAVDMGEIYRAPRHWTGEP